MNDDWYHAWHYQQDALPFIVHTDDDGIELHIVTGTWSQYGPDTEQSVAVNWCIIDPDGKPGPTTTTNSIRIDGQTIGDLNAQQPPSRKGARVPYRPYTILSSNLGTDGYYETVIPIPHPPTEIHYTIQATAKYLVTPKTLGMYAVVADDPHFDIADMFGGRTGSFTDPTPSWIGFTRNKDGWLQIRIDLDDLPIDKAVPVMIRVGNKLINVDPTTVQELTGPGKPPQHLPLVDWYTDIITVTVRAPDTSPVSVEAYGRRMRVPPHKQPGTTRLLLAHFCIQAINDLLEVPFPGYDPPRTYMQVTMRDEDGKYSSRPDRAPGKDGYSFGLDAQRRFNVPYHLALNGGVLALMQHDCQNNAAVLKDDVTTIRQDINDGLLHLAVPGYGSHRVPYYSAATNKRDIEACLQVQESIFGRRGNLIYLDQRLYRQDRNTLPLLTDTEPEYVIFDSDTGYYDNEDSIDPCGATSATDPGPNYLWHDKKSGKRVLFIDDQLKDDAFGGRAFSTSPLVLGKPDLALRQRFMRFALDPNLRDRNVLVYGDDFEKASGNGWFEGIPDMKEKFSAFLEWVSAHQPWLQCITTETLDTESPIGTINVKTATDPILDPGGVKSTDIYGDLLHFDSWENDWYYYPALWIGGFLGEITAHVERALTNWPGRYRNELFETAWLSFLMYQHENAWNKQPLEGSDPNTRPDGDPEDFTIVEGLQVRNTLVWLKASIWARWASFELGKPRGADTDPLRDLIQTLPAVVGPPARDADHWDADPMETIVLYNEQALVLLDRNGGRVTHAFVLRNRIPTTVSGTFKSYQYRNAAGVDCDGPVLQNTVWTPNHRYIGSDLGLIQGAPTVTVVDNRPGLVALVQRVLPDNFNEYRVDHVADDHTKATFTYDPSPIGPPARLSENQLAQLFRQDGEARRNGTEGTIIWHGADSCFSKTFTLAGTKLSVSYTGVKPRHLVDNEFCVDLYGGLMKDVTLAARMVSNDAQMITLTSKSDDTRAGSVTIRCTSGCSIEPSSLITDTDSAGDQLSQFLSIHRVLTESVQIRANSAEGGTVNFGYEIDLNAAE